MSDNLGSQLISSRLTTILRLREFADEIDIINKDSKIALLSGTSASILGAVVGVPLSITAIVLTGGIAAIPIAAGVFAGVGAAGGIIAFGAGVGGHFHIKSKYRQALAAVEADRALGLEYLNSCRITRGAIAGVGGVAFVIRQGADIAELALRAGEGALDGAAAATRAAKVAKAAAVGKVAGGIGIAVSIILLPVDIYILVETSKDIHYERRHENAEELRRIANELEQSLPDLRNFLSSSDDAE